MAPQPTSTFRRIAIPALLLAILLCLLATPRHALAEEGTDPGSTDTFTYGSGENARPYIVYTPTTYRRSKPAPLVVMTHGCQTTAEEQMHANLYNRLAERNGFVVLYPDVTRPRSSSPGRSRSAGGSTTPTAGIERQVTPAAIAGMTHAVMDRKRIDPQRVYMVGMSAGSFMTSIMAGDLSRTSSPPSRSTPAAPTPTQLHRRPRRQCRHR